RTGVSQGSFTGDLQHARRAGSPTPSSASSPRLGPLNLSTRDRSPQAERHIAARPAAPPRAPLRPSHRSAPRTAPPLPPLRPSGSNELSALGVTSSALRP